MRFLYLLLLLMPFPIMAQELKVQSGDTQTKNLTTETEAAIQFLQRVPPEDQPFIRFFTTYAIPLDMREDAVLALSFVCHSLAGISDDGTTTTYYPLAKKDENGTFIDYARTPQSNTLWYIDIRNFNWTPAAWETISTTDGYFYEPAVDRDTNYLLKTLAGSAIVRADWFIVHATDMNAQADNGTPIDIYNTLLYASQKTPPKTIDEFRVAWGLDIEKAVKLGNQYGALSLTSKAVARHNRVLMGCRTELGWLYESYDIKAHIGNQDFLESFPQFKGGPPTTSEAGEIFATNHLKMQVYALRNKEGALVSFADPTVARHMNDINGDARVRTAVSCMDCHSAGPIPAENVLADYSDWLKLEVPVKKDSQKIDASFLSDKFEESIGDNQALFARALLKVNGLDPATNAKTFLKIVRWYHQPIDLQQMAFECGVSVETYIDKANNVEDTYDKPYIPGRIKLALHPTKPIPIPRDAWETKGADGIPGLFQQSMVMINGLTAIIQQTDEIKTETKIIDPEFTHITVKDAPLMSGSKELLTIPKGTKLKIKNSVDKAGVVWLGATFNNTNGYILSSNLEVLDLNENTNKD